MNRQLQAVIKNLRILLLNLILQILVMNGMLGAVTKRRRSPSQPKGQESELSQNRHLVVTMTVTKERVLNLKKVNMWECLHSSHFLIFWMTGVISENFCTV